MGSESYISTHIRHSHIVSHAHFGAESWCGFAPGLVCIYKPTPPNQYVGVFIANVKMTSQQLDPKATPLAEVEERECTNSW